MDRLGRIALLKNMLQKEPEDVFLNYALGLEYVGEPETHAEAESYFKKTIALDSAYLAAYYQLGKLFESLSNKKEALIFYTLGLQKAREQKNLKSAGEFDEAIFLLED